MSAPRVGGILRYTSAVRINHWIVAICFVLLALSGLAMFHPALFWLTTLFGGGSWTRLLHPFIGCLIVLAFLPLAAKMWAQNYLTKTDLVWLRNIKEVIYNREQELPEVGRYNGGQKLLFFTIVMCLPVLLLSGLLIWRQYFSAYFSIQWVRIGALLHSFFALVLICTIIVHIYAAIWVKGSIRAMTRGGVSFGWAWKHHRAWFREVTKRVEER